MKELPEQFIGTGEVKGFVFTKLNESPTAYMYEVVTPDESIHWEVFERKETKAGIVTIGGMSVAFEAKVTYPKANHFGVWAWCFSNSEQAISKFKSL